MGKLSKKRGEIVKSGEMIQLVSFKLGGETFAVHVDQVREIGRVEEITQVPKMQTFIEGVMNLRGQITTIIDLRRRFDISGDGGHSSDSRVIVAEIGDVQIGIIVDSVQDVIRVPMSNLSEPPKTVSNNIDTRFLTGICKIQDGLIMLIDLAMILGNDELDQILKIESEAENN